MLQSTNYDYILNLLTTQFNKTTATLSHLEHQLSVAPEYRLEPEIPETEIMEAVVLLRSELEDCTGAIQDFKAHKNI